ncbi:hypothetical protein PAESOLCIP111_03158 [Paenibacillus solanacearum]|uniref:Copper amine oxidase-like N-terminal domain-containing protein n=2 Tax=Paenibacillus solanacearum TaxID=2048548 RepID=A0A916K209_9BACL|nr:hypothetical protein PAESOLCIP111_03158 [Paenibacillus solanacearum]
MQLLNMLLMCAMACVWLPAAYAADSQQGAAGQAAEAIVLTLNERVAVVRNAEVTLDAPPVLVRDTTMVPLRFIGESLGAKIAWDAATKNITLTNGTDRIALKLDQTYATINGKRVLLEQPAVLMGDTTMVPLRFIAEAIKLDVAFDADRQSITLTGQGTGSGPSPRKKLGQPTVENLTQQLVQYKGGTHLINNRLTYEVTAQSEILSIAAADANQVYILKKIVSGSNAYQLLKWNGKDGTIAPEAAFDFDEKLSFDYLDRYNLKSSMDYRYIVPQKLYYDDASRKLYLQAAPTKAGFESDLSTVIYEISPNVKMVTYFVSKNTNDESHNFFAAAGDNAFYYGDLSTGKLCRAKAGERCEPFSSFSSERGNNKLTAAVRGDEAFVFDPAQQRLSKVTPNGLEDVVRLNVDRIRSAASRNGLFYVANDRYIYELNTEGKLTEYVDLQKVVYKRGVFNPVTKRYDTMDAPDSFSRTRLSVPGVIEWTPESILSADASGNLVMYDSKSSAVRKINVYPE